MLKDFYKLNKTPDKKQSSSTHKSQYFGTVENFNLNISEIKNAKKYFLKEEDNKIIDDICFTLEKNNRLPFSWTHQENFYLNNCENFKSKIEYLVYRYKFKVYPEKKYLSNFPTHVLIEPASICNLRCVMCYQMDNKFTGDDIKKNSNKEMMGKMDLELFKKVIDECSKEGAGAISIGSRGEPMINTKFIDMVNYLRDKKFYDIKINSNGSAITEKISHAILQSDINILVISCDANDPDLYSKIRRGGNFKRLLKNIDLINRIRKSDYKNSKLEIRISGVYFHPDQNENDFYNFWKDKVDTVSYVKVQNRWDTYNNPKIIEKNNPCDFLWEKLYVWWDGTTNPCDEDYLSLLSPGNVNNNSIKDIWNSKKFNDLRELHLSNNRINKKPCDRCNV